MGEEAIDDPRAQRPPNRERGLALRVDEEGAVDEHVYDSVVEREEPPILSVTAEHELTEARAVRRARDVDVRCNRRAPMQHGRVLQRETLRADALVADEASMQLDHLVSDVEAGDRIAPASEMKFAPANPCTWRSFGLLNRSERRLPAESIAAGGAR